MHLYRRIGRIAATFVLAMGAAGSMTGCSDSTEPEGPFAGDYDLILINGNSLPARYQIYGFGATKELLGGSLSFGSNRIAEVRQWRDNPIGAQSLENTFSTTATYSVEGSFLIIDRPRLDGMTAAYADTGYVEGETLILPVRTVDGTTVQHRTLTYVRR